MKKILLAGILFVSGLFTSAHATTNCDLASGTTTANQQAAITAAAANSCTVAGNVPNGHTVFYQAGNFSVTSQLTLGCPNQAAGVLITGPTQDTTVWPITPTAILTNSGMVNTAGFHGAACSNGTSFQFLQYNGANPSSGGGFLFVPAGMNNLSIKYNVFSGVSAQQTASNIADTIIWMDGSDVAGSTHTQNTTIQFNRIGLPNSSDCANLMNVIGGQYRSTSPYGVCAQSGSLTYNPGGQTTVPAGYSGSGTAMCLYQDGDVEKSSGGYCAGVGVHVMTDSLNISNNVFAHVEQGIKYFEGCGSQSCADQFYTTNQIANANDFTQTHRITIEAQQTLRGSPFQLTNNSMHDELLFGGVSWGISVPQSSLTTDTQVPTITSNNLMIDNSAHGVDKNGYSASRSYGVEFWGYGAQSQNNLIQGIWGGSYAWGFGGSNPSSATFWNISNNTMQQVTTLFEGYITNEEGASNTPTQAGNVTSHTVTAATSAAPTIAPSLGTQNFPLTVTLTDAGFTSGSLPLGNTGIWYTIDGSTPVPGSGTAKRLNSGGTFTLASAATVKAVGMWGALNQPTSYPSGYGFVPSNIVSVTYSGGSAPTIVSGYLSTTPTNGINTASVGGTIQFAPIANYSNGANNQPIAPTACSWDTTDHTKGTIGTTTGLFTAVASTGTGVVSVIATCSGVPFSQWDVAVSAPVGPTLTGLSTSPSAIYSTKNTSLSAVGTFSDGSTGAATGTWASSNTSVAQVDQGGNITPQGVGTSYISVTNGSLSAMSVVIVPPSVLYDNPIQTTSFPYSNSNFGCFVFQKLPTGNYTLVVNADGSFTVTPQ